MSLLASARGFVTLVREENVPFMAASIAYYAIVSVVPIFVLALSLLAVFGAVQPTVDLVRATLDGTAERVLETLLMATRGRTVAGLVGLLIAVWSGMQVFRGLTVAFAEIYGEESDLTVAEQLLRSVVVLVLLLFTLVLLVATGLVLEFVDLPVVYPRLVGTAAAFLVLVVALVPLYYLLSPASVSLGHVLPGAVLTALGWIVLQVCFLYYARSTASYVAYGLLGAVLLFVTFLYLAAIVLLAGAVLNVAGDRRTHRPEI
jgi:membrane protein